MSIQSPPHEKVIFFDCYQTLVDIDIKEENKKKNQARAWENFAKSLEQYGIRAGAGELFELSEKRQKSFYAGKDKGIRHHNLCDILGQVFRDDLGVEVPEEKICSFWVKNPLTADQYIHLFDQEPENMIDLEEFTKLPEMIDKSIFDV